MVIESSILAGFRIGDHRCFAIVFHQHYRSLIALAESQIGEIPVVQDIVQDSFVKLWERHSSFESLSGISVYLRRVTQISCIQYRENRRWEKEQQRSYVVQLVNAMESVHSRANEAELLSRVLAAVQTLPKVCRGVVNLLYIEGMREEEVSAALRISIGAVRNERARAIYLLKKYFGKVPHIKYDPCPIHLGIADGTQILDLLRLCYFQSPTEHLQAPNIISRRRVLQTLVSLSRIASAAIFILIFSTGLLRLINQNERQAEASLFELPTDHQAPTIRVAGIASANHTFASYAARNKLPAYARRITYGNPVAAYPRTVKLQRNSLAPGSQVSLSAATVSRHVPEFKLVALIVNGAPFTGPVDDIAVTDIEGVISIWSKENCPNPVVKTVLLITTRNAPGPKTHSSSQLVPYLNADTGPCGPGE